MICDLKLEVQKLLLRLHMLSDIKEKKLSAKGICNKLLGSTLIKTVRLQIDIISIWDNVS